MSHALRSLHALFHPQGAGRSLSLRAQMAYRLHLLRSRRALARLDDDQLHDIGITRACAEREAQRGIWNAPNHWTS